MFEPVQTTCKNHANIGFSGTPLTWYLRLRRGSIDNLLIIKRFLNSNGFSLALSILLFFEAIEISYFAFFCGYCGATTLEQHCYPSPYAVCQRKTTVYQLSIYSDVTDERHSLADERHSLADEWYLTDGEDYGGPYKGYY